MSHFTTAVSTDQELLENKKICDMRAKMSVDDFNALSCILKTVGIVLVHLSLSVRRKLIRGKLARFPKSVIEPFQDSFLP